MATGSLMGLPGCVAVRLPGLGAFGRAFIRMRIVAYGRYRPRSPRRTIAPAGAPREAAPVAACEDGPRTRLPRGGSAIPDDLAAANVNRAYSLAATSIAIFTFMLIFLYPKLASGEANPLLFQATVIVMA